MFHIKWIHIIILFVAISYESYAQAPQLIDGYTDKLSYRYTTGGTVVTFYLRASTCQIGCNLTLQLEDLLGNVIYTIGSIDVPANQSITNTNPWENNFGYIVSQTTWTIPSAISSGYYLVNGKIPIIIKGDNTSADIVIVCPTNTINAYTSSGGNSLYDPPISTVSFLRPQSRTDYLHCDDGMLDWIRSWAAGHNPTYTLNFISDADMDDWNEIKDADLVIIPGHSEYWTRQARLNFDKFVDGDIQNNIPGKNALILSGNTMWWQVRYQNTSTNPQLICHRGDSWGNAAFIDDPIAMTDPLLATYHWLEPDLKYSILGNIGSDFLRGGLKADAYLGGPKVLFDNTHPLLNGTSLTVNDIIPIPGNFIEYDGTLMKADANGNVVDANGNIIVDHSATGPDPVLDISALGFYRAEILGYNSSNQTYPNPSNGNAVNYCPILIFNKTCTSGTIINVNSNMWCASDPPNNPLHYSWENTNNSPLRAQITANMISRLLQNQTVYSSIAVPTSITISPAFSNVSYYACLDGSIDFTPCGIYVNNSYKIDNGYTRDPNHANPSCNYWFCNFNSNISMGEVDLNCSNYQLLRIGESHSLSEENSITLTEKENIVIFPNPTNGKFILRIFSQGEKNIFIFNSLGQEILQLPRISSINTEVDLTNSPKGVYFVKVLGNGFLSSHSFILE